LSATNSNRTVVYCCGVHGGCAIGSELLTVLNICIVLSVKSIVII
jgi:hypothetical protein